MVKIAIVVLLFTIAFAAALRLEGPPPATPPVDRPLEMDEANPPFILLREAWPPRPGTELWLHPDRSKFATILEVDGDVGLVQWDAGGSNWVNLRHLRNAWIAQPEPAREVTQTGER